MFYKHNQVSGKLGSSEAQATYQPQGYNPLKNAGKDPAIEPAKFHQSKPVGSLANILKNQKHFQPSRVGFPVSTNAMAAKRLIYAPLGLVVQHVSLIFSNPGTKAYVHVAGGPKDVLLYRTIMGVSFVGIAVSFYSIFQMATGRMKKKN